MAVRGAFAALVWKYVSDSRQRELQMVNGTGNGIGIGPAFKEYRQMYLSVTLNEKNPKGRIEKPHNED